MNTERIVRIHGDDVSVVYSDGTKTTIGDSSSGQTTDGYHSFDELYRHRSLLTAALFNSWGPEMNAYKTWQHHPDDDTSMFAGMFKIGATLPTGEVSYHVNAVGSTWNLFHIPVLDHSPLWDGHTADDVAARLEAFLRNDF